MSQSFYSNKPFNTFSRMADDVCEITARDEQNKTVAERNLYNFYRTHDCKCPLFDQILFENNMVAKDGYGVTAGCTIDNDSKLRLDGQLTQDKGPIQLCTRWYHGNPDLSKGGVCEGGLYQCIGTELDVKFGSETRNNSTGECCRPLSEKDYDRFVPLTGCLAGGVQNVDNIVEPWTRGGSHTRNDQRSSAYACKMTV
jgi:hypothetical protein